MDRKDLCPESVHLVIVYRRECRETILVSQELKSFRSIWKAKAFRYIYCAILTGSKSVSYGRVEYINREPGTY